MREVRAGLPRNGAKPGNRSVISDREGRVLGELLEQWVSPAAAALAKGRIFVDGQRELHGDRVLAAGACVEIRGEPDRGSAVELLGEYRGLWAVNKPADMPTEPDRQGSQGCLLDVLAGQENLPRAALHAVNRLDLNVSGVVLVAATAEARRWAVQLREAGGLQRQYIALSGASPTPLRGTWQEPVRAKGQRISRAATTRYHCLASAAQPVEGHYPALLRLIPQTGRTHQLRVHAAQAGVSFLGDRAYGGVVRWVGVDGSVFALSRVLLHAFRITLTSAKGPLWTAKAPLPSVFEDVWARLQGAASVFAQIEEETEL